MFLFLPSFNTDPTSTFSDQAQRQDGYLAALFLTDIHYLGQLQHQHTMCRYGSSHYAVHAELSAPGSPNQHCVRCHSYKHSQGKTTVQDATQYVLTKSGGGL